MRIRPIQPDELLAFAGAATHSEHVGAVHDYVSDLLMNGSMRTEWCYVLVDIGANGHHTDDNMSTHTTF